MKRSLLSCVQVVTPQAVGRIVVPRVVMAIAAACSLRVCTTWSVGATAVARCAKKRLSGRRRRWVLAINIIAGLTTARKLILYVIPQDQTRKYKKVKRTGLQQNTVRAIGSMRRVSKCAWGDGDKYDGKNNNNNKNNIHEQILKQKFNFAFLGGTKLGLSL
jgi:hypothetical protein